MTLTFKPDLDNLPLDLHAKIQVCTSVRSAVRVRQKDRRTETQTMPKLLHPSLTLGVIRFPVTNHANCLLSAKKSNLNEADPSLCAASMFKHLVQFVVKNIDSNISNIRYGQRSPFDGDIPVCDIKISQPDLAVTSLGAENNYSLLLAKPVHAVFTIIPLIHHRFVSDDDLLPRKKLHLQEIDE